MKIKKRFKASIGLILSIAMVAALFVAVPVSATESGDGFDGKLIAEYEFITSEGQLGEDGETIVWSIWSSSSKGTMKDGREATMNKASFVDVANTSNAGTKIKVQPKEALNLTGEEYLEFWIYSEKYAPTQVILDFNGWKNVPINVKADQWNFVRVPVLAGNLTNIYLDYTSVKNESDTNAFEIYFSDFSIRKYEIEAECELITADGGIGAAASKTSWGNGGWVAGGQTIADRKAYRTHASFAGHNSEDGVAPAADKLKVVFKENISIVGDEYAEFWVYSEKYAPTQVILDYGTWTNVSVDIEADKWNFVRVPLNEGTLNNIFLNYGEVKNANETNKADTSLFMIYLSDFSIIRRENIVDIMGSETGEVEQNVKASETLTFTTDLLSGVYDSTVIVAEYNTSGVIGNVKILTSEDMTYSVGDSASTVKVFLWNSISGMTPLAVDKELTVQVQQN